jgi:hypothetical protein
MVLSSFWYKYIFEFRSLLIRKNSQCWVTTFKLFIKSKCFVLVNCITYTNVPNRHRRCKFCFIYSKMNLNCQFFKSLNSRATLWTTTVTKYIHSYYSHCITHTNFREYDWLDSKKIIIVISGRWSNFLEIVAGTHLPIEPATQARLKPDEIENAQPFNFNMRKELVNALPKVLGFLQVLWFPPTENVNRMGCNLNP